MGFNDILGIFVDVKKDETPEGATVTSILGTPNTLINKSTTKIETKVSPVTSNSTADLDKFIAHFDELFEKTNLPGPDYFEFSKMVKAIAAPGMTSDMKLTVAFAGLSVQGLTVNNLLTSAQKYLEIIDEDAKSFSQALNSKVSVEIEEKKKLANSLSEKMKQKQEMIEQLQLEIANDTLTIENVNNDIAEQETTIASKANAYKVACESKKQEISDDIQKINTYLNK